MQNTNARRKAYWYRLLAGGVAIGALALVAWGALIEADRSHVQSRLFSKLAKEMTYDVDAGPTSHIRFPDNGPYDQRLGYSHLPRFIAALEEQGYVVERQARMSPQLQSFIDYGGFSPYPEKWQAGFKLVDRRGEVIFQARYPQRVFADFAAIPPVLVATLLFVENRELLDVSIPTRNPAVEWDRFAAAAANTVTQHFNDGNRFGGSTLATQIEKYRHSPYGRTGSVGEKLRQITSASMRAYLDGPDTSAARQRIVLEYMNSTPLSARPGFGEVIGIGDGLFAWFGIELAEVSRLLGGAPSTIEEEVRAAEVYKAALSLTLAQRRPSFYLIEGRDGLEALTNAHLSLLAEAGLITSRTRDLALAAPLRFRQTMPAPEAFSFVERKAVNAVRSHVAGALEVPYFYDLDRLDLRAETSLDHAAQERVIARLRELMEPKAAAAAGLMGERMLRGRPDGVVYSVTLYERVGGLNMLRVQADNLEQPLDINEGGKFDLGSTAKLRTLINYLEIIAELHDRFVGASREDLRELEKNGADPLSRWVAGWLVDAKDTSLQAIIDAAMMRKYSGNPGQSFFTGRGVHQFGNFNRGHNSRMIPVTDAMRESVNLVFIRMMQDIVRYYQAGSDEEVQQIIADSSHPSRQAYLSRFADMEGKIFLNQFWRRYAGLTADEAVEKLAKRAPSTGYRLATAFLSVRPEASLDAFRSFMQAHGHPSFDDDDLTYIYHKYGPDKFNLHDRGYISRIHPLELWLVHYLQSHPSTDRKAMLDAAIEVRQEVYQWLFNSKRKRTVDNRIRIILEEDAFEQVHRAWERLGYPFPSLVPSLATALGTSADRPAALAELMGTILNDGVRVPTARVTRLSFAEGTPYETHMALPSDPERILPREIAGAVRQSLIGVVEGGTAKRLAGTFKDADGRPLPTGGKTGTGDELADRYGPGTSAGKSKEVSRSAAFTFFIGDRFFGVITAYVPGVNSRAYRFTSALPVQVLKALAPALQPLITDPPELPAKPVRVMAEAKESPLAEPASQ
ncbi:MAG: glycosyl transferase family 51 [Rhodospirillales bacterium]|nr:glycosyl transferase family 51 [Rhodospirillales bacterium]